MHVEIRKFGRSKKYYLVHASRIGRKIKKIVRYLGSNLTKEEIIKLRKRAETLILEQIKDQQILDYELNDEEISLFKKYDQKINIEHFNKYDFRKFTEIFTYNTNAIEGSTVTLKHTKELIEEEEIPVEPDEVETIDVAEALEFMRQTEEDVSVEFIKKIHKLCFKGTRGYAGKIRDVEVVIRDSNGIVIHRGAPSEKVLGLLDDLMEWYHDYKKKYPPLYLAAIVHNEFETIHPFQDGNGRVGRILLNYILKKHKYPYINIRLKNRSEYYHVLYIHQHQHDIKPTLRFLIKQYKTQYRYIGGNKK